MSITPLPTPVTELWAKMLEMLEMLEQTARMPEVIATGQIAVWVGKKRRLH